MRSKKYVFTVKIHEEYGTLGFTPSWYRAGDPLGGLAVAHDILEHFPNDTGTAEEEYMALGASLFIRGDSGYYGHKGGNADPEANIASDMPTIWGVQSYVRPCPKPRDTDTLERAFAAIEHYKKELSYHSDTEGLPTETDLTHIAYWIVKGYQRAKKRYRNHGNAVAWSLFQPIEEQADKMLKFAEEGMVLTVLIDWRRGMLCAQVGCDYPYQEEY